MIIAGPCLYNPGDSSNVFRTATNLIDVADIFRVKLWGGGTAADKWFPGIGVSDEIAGLRELCGLPIPAITEVQTERHVVACSNWDMHGVWIGARNCMNYALMSFLFNENYLNESRNGKAFQKIMFKRGPGMSIDDTVKIADLYREKGNIEPYIIERGITTNDTGTAGRWSPDLKIAYFLKHTRPELFNKLIIDCSHSAGDKRYVRDIYEAFNAVGCKHFMFEVFDGESKTDKEQILKSEELKAWIK